MGANPQLSVGNGLNITKMLKGGVYLSKKHGFTEFSSCPETRFKRHSGDKSMVCELDHSGSQPFNYVYTVATCACRFHNVLIFLHNKNNSTVAIERLEIQLKAFCQYKDSCSKWTVHEESLHISLEVHIP